MRSLLLIIVASVLALSTQGCSADVGSNEPRGDVDIGVCEFLLEKQRQGLLDSVLESGHYLAPGLYVFDVSKYVKEGGAKSVVSMVSGGVRFSIFFAFGDVKLVDGRIPKSANLSQKGLEFVHSAFFFVYEGFPYVVTKLSNLESDVRGSVYSLKNSKFELICK